MKQLIVLFGMLTVPYAALENSPSQPPTEQKIVGGKEASIKDFPYQAGLIRNKTLECGAVIIGPETLLTVAHCVVPSFIPKIQQMSFRVGSSKWSDGGKLIAVRKRIIHELYKDCDTCFDYDIAIVELAEKIDVPFAAPISLVEENETFPDGTLATVSGWGTTIFNVSAYPETLRKVDVPLVNQATCRSAYGSILTERFICAGFSTGGKDACNADSGGPLAHAGKLIGVVAFGNGCADPKYPGVYSSIAKYRDWIRKNSGI